MVFEKPFTPYLACVREGSHKQWPLWLVIRELSPGEHSVFRSHANRLVENYRDNQMYLCVLMNYREYIGESDTYKAQSADNADRAPSLLGGEVLMLNMNRLIMNILSAVRSFLDLTDRNLQHRFGTESERYKTFKAATKDAFDNSFAYRFLYKLRNYVQHCGMPVGKLSFSMRYEDDTGQHATQTVDFAFSRDGLLSNYDSWGNKVKPELESLPDYFPIQPLISEMMQCLDKLQLSQTAANAPALIESLGWLDRMLLEASWRGGMPCICIREPLSETEEDCNIQIDRFPLELMEMLRKPLHKVFGVGTEQYFT